MGTKSFQILRLTSMNYVSLEDRLLGLLLDQLLLLVRGLAGGGQSSSRHYGHSLLFPRHVCQYYLNTKHVGYAREPENDAYCHPRESLKLDTKTIITKHFARLIRKLFTETMVLCIDRCSIFAYRLS
jgi:hypothetical protein